MTSIRRPIFLGLMVLLACAALPLAASDSSPAPATPTEPPAAALDQQLFTPEPEPAGQCITCEGWHSTDQNWAMGANCTQALANLEDLLRPEATQFCRDLLNKMLTSACNFQLDAVCYWDPAKGSFIADGHANHGCLEGDYFCPEW